MSNVKLTIDGRPIAVAPGTTILSAGFDGVLAVHSLSKRSNANWESNPRSSLHRTRTRSVRAKKGWKPSRRSRPSFWYSGKNRSPSRPPGAPAAARIKSSSDPSAASK